MNRPTIRLFEDAPVSRRFRLFRNSAATPPVAPRPRRPAPSLVFLTERQKTVLAVLCETRDRPAAADRLGISPRTVAWFVGTIVHATHADGLDAACRLLAERGGR